MSRGDYMGGSDCVSGGDCVGGGDRVMEVMAHRVWWRTGRNTIANYHEIWCGRGRLWVW